MRYYQICLVADLWFAQHGDSAIAEPCRQTRTYPETPAITPYLLVCVDIHLYRTFEELFPLITAECDVRASWPTDTTEFSVR